MTKTNGKNSRNGLKRGEGIANKAIGQGQMWEKPTAKKKTNLIVKMK